LHEGLGSVAAWRTFPADLAARTGWRVFAYSRRGYGASDSAALPRLTTFMHEEAIEELPLVLDALELTRPVILGHSDGGSIALIFAAHHPDRARALVLEAPHVFVEDISVASIARMKIAYETTDLRARLERFHGNNVDVAFRGWNDVWLDADFRAWNIEAILPRVTCPTLVIQGEGDEYGTLAQLDAIRSQIGGPTQTLVLPDCGHAPHHRHRGPVLDEVERFLSMLPT
jgi:pimeloyl-ACP methyl ester carboxylesterase